MYLNARACTHAQVAGAASLEGDGLTDEELQREVAEGEPAASST